MSTRAKTKAVKSSLDRSDAAKLRRRSRSDMSPRNLPRMSTQCMTTRSKSRDIDQRFLEAPRPRRSKQSEDEAPKAQGRKKTAVNKSTKAPAKAKANVQTLLDEGDSSDFEDIEELQPPAKAKGTRTADLKAPGPSNSPIRHIASPRIENRLDQQVPSTSKENPIINTGSKRSSVYSTKVKKEKLDDGLVKDSRADNAGERAHEKPEEASIPEVPDEIAPPHLWSNWSHVLKAVKFSCKNIENLITMISHYNKQATEGGFLGLKDIFRTIFNSQISGFFRTIRGVIIPLTLESPVQLSPIPTLKNNNPSSFSLSNKQIGCILANAFLCTCPENYGVTSINFSQFFEVPEITDTASKKFTSIMKYFEYQTNKNPNSRVTFQRIKIPRGNLSSELRKKIIRYAGIENEQDEHHSNSLQFIFTNGENVFSEFEGLDFFTYPELLILKLCAEPLETNEAFLITGVQYYSEYRGVNLKNIIMMKPGSFDWSNILFWNSRCFINELNRIYSASACIPPGIRKKMRIITADLMGDQGVQFVILNMIAAAHNSVMYFYTHDDEVRENEIRHIWEHIQHESIQSVFQAMCQYFDHERKPTLSYFLEICIGEYEREDEDDF